MKTFLTKARSVSASINGQTLTTQPGETVLQAAERHGMKIPNSCRVGACGTCKCRLLTGSVHELTETAYLLSADEIDRGVILACQSVPTTDVQIEVEQLPPAAGPVTGKIVDQERLTHDITRLSIALDQPLHYQAGQYALLSIDGIPNTVRSYSFANPADAEGVVQFIIRKVPGGILSTPIHDDVLFGREVTLDGPHGDFHLRPGGDHLLFVAGGSGLAPILAILEEAIEAGESRAATLLFGARTEADLYALEEIQSISQRWHAAFEFIPVLSAKPADSTWNGATGMVTEWIVDRMRPTSLAYLCGPPAMVDRAVDVLHRHGLTDERIYFDRFTTQADIASVQPPATTLSAPSPAAWTLGSILGSLHYLKFFLFHFVGILSVIAILAGGSMITYGLLAILGLYMLGDALSGDDTSTPEFKHPGILTFQLWLALPLLCFVVFAAVWSVCPGDPLGFGRILSDLTGYDLLAARAATHFGHHVSAVIMTGLMIGMVGTITAHELTHRTWDPISLLIGRWLLAFSFDTIFSIEHVYGHHRYVSTLEDPATAPRGRNVYYHIVASTIKGNISAWEIEAERLRKRHLPVVSWHNAMIRGHLMSVLLVVTAWCMGGWAAMTFFVLSGLWGKALLEIVNYMEHYGIVRNPETPVQPRHSWNTNRRISSWSMFNLTRHSHHHAQGEVPYQELKPFPDAPMMINGYLTTIVIAMIPPLWHFLMTPKLADWDQRFATDEERELARLANARSGLRSLQKLAMD